mmetsp:Transcript_15833/g.32322  ORF Transcript_15833/g.32322 Transcript_15833/m.32322 type:complete len:225 (-) Transcript_15833:859-1533(-)
MLFCSTRSSIIFLVTSNFSSTALRASLLILTFSDSPPFVMSNFSSCKSMTLLIIPSIFESMSALISSSSLVSRTGLSPPRSSLLSGALTILRRPLSSVDLTVVTEPPAISLATLPQAFPAALSMLMSWSHRSLLRVTHMSTFSWMLPKISFRVADVRCSRFSISSSSVLMAPKRSVSTMCSLSKWVSLCLIPWMREWYCKTLRALMSSFPSGSLEAAISLVKEW